MADIERARQLRKDDTWAEKLMWRWLRDRRFSGYKFRRQHPLGSYYLDFFCEAAELISNWMAASTVFPINVNMIWNGKSFCKRAASRHYGFGIHGCGAMPRLSAIPSSTNCKVAHRSRCQNMPSR